MHPTFNLYDNGCIVNHTLDCSIACLDADLIFASPYTLQNCLVMVALEELLALKDPTIGVESRAVLHDFSIDLEAPPFRSLAADVVQIVQNCLGQFCETIPRCDSAVDKHYDYYCYGGLSAGPRHSFDGVCASVVAPLNGGIGVMTSVNFTAEHPTNMQLGLHLILDAKRYSTLSIHTTEALRQSILSLVYAHVLPLMAIGLGFCMALWARRDSTESPLYAVWPTKALGCSQICHCRVSQGTVLLHARYRGCSPGCRQAGIIE